MGFVRSQAVSIEAGKIKQIWRPLIPFMDIREMLADDTIAEGQACMYDYTELDAAIGSTTAIDTVAKARAVAALLSKVIPTGTDAAGEPACCGVALHAASAGDKVYLVVGGVCPKVLISTDDVADGDGLVAAAVAGAVETYASGTHTKSGPIGVSISTETTNAGYVAAILRPLMS